MAYDPDFKYYLIDPATGEFYTADEVNTGGWLVNPTTPTEAPLKTLPMGWNGLKLKWVRNSVFMGSYRSSSTDLIFSQDGRAILNYLIAQRFSQAQCILRIDKCFATTTGWEYRTVYKCYINFESCRDNLQDLLLTAGTLDGGLFSRLELNGDSDFNLPFWESDGGGGWTTDGIFIQDRGIKLLYDARFTSGATVAAPITYNIIAFPSGPSPAHTNPSMTNSQIVPYIGNEILVNNVKIGTQSFHESNVGYANYADNDYLIKDLLAGTIPNMKYLINATITNILYNNPTVGESRFYRFQLSELDNTDTLTNEFLMLDIEIANNPSAAADAALNTGAITIVDNVGSTSNPLVTFNIWTPFAMTFDRVYAFTIRCISSLPGFDPGSMGATFTSLTVDITSQPIAGLGDTDLRFPESHYLAFRPHQVLEKIVPMLNSTSTDPNGFAIIPAGTNYVGRSDFLSDPAQTLAANYDNIPYQTGWTSGNAIRLTSGQTYLTTSLSTFFKTCFGIWGCGMAIEKDTSGEPNVIRIEPLQYFYDKDTLLFDLGADIYGPETMPMMDYLGGNLKAGYATKWRDFSSYIGTSLSYYGIDAFNFEQGYRMPFFTGEKKTLDWTVAPIAEMYQKEAARAAQNASGLSSTNADNGNYLIEIESMATVPIEAREPGGVVLPTTAYYTTAYPTISTTGPTTPPFARGLIYPDTAQNLGLTPAKNLRRNGAFLHAICGGLDDKNVMFQKQYWQLLNGNINIAEAGIATNLNSGLITEVEDIAVSGLADKLFLPEFIRFTTKQPINMYEIMDNNPNGYIQFTYNKKTGYGDIIVKGFIWDVEQDLGTDAATQFTLVLHPDTDLDILRT